jgi:hypothetical protein
MSFSSQEWADVNQSADSTHCPKAMWQEVIAGLTDLGIGGEIRKDWISEVGYDFDVSFRGLLYDGRDRSKGKVRVDINRRLETDIASAAPQRIQRASRVRAKPGNVPPMMKRSARLDLSPAPVYNEVQFKPKADVLHTLRNAFTICDVKES